MADNAQIKALISKLSQHLNASESEVTDALNKGNLTKILQNMDAQKAQQINNVLSDPEQAQKVLSSPQAQALIKKLMG